MDRRMDVNLILFKKNGSQKVITLPSKVTVIGRRKDCDLRIPLMPVSRRHCQLILNNETLKIRDLGSRNGTFLNGQRIEEASAKAGDNITIGPLTFAVQINGQPKEFAPPGPAAKAAPATQKPPFDSAQGKPQQEKPVTKPSAKKESENLEELTIDEKAEELPELNISKDEDSFLDELEKL